MILCLMLRFAFLHLSRWLHRSIGIWGHNQKTALLIPLQQRGSIYSIKLPNLSPSALFAFHFSLVEVPPCRRMWRTEWVGWILSPKQSPDFRPFSPGGEYINSTSGHPSPCVTSASVLETRSPGAAWQYHKRSSLCQPITKSMYVHTKKLSGSNSSLERQPKFPSVELPPDPSQPHVNVALSIRH
ncbi:hypothetical protein CISG_06633 [Coccidioides immitis RMSCC 3703]|uniref:Uncharacterized protein n=1 Tax=Coccidioides immitis RMSCC 3703 TaxID=454286 RepID=A0A0J8QY44_COCIT|nr:hypothetical protein CISG_06633 [Coccidioides immitis RMSCC 3703]